MKKLFRITVCVCLMLSMMMLFVACTAAPVYASPRAKKAVATAGNMEILYEELYFVAMQKIDELKKTHGENALEDEAVYAELEGFVWGNLLTKEVALRSLALDYGIRTDKGDVADNVQVHIESILEESFAGDRGAYIDSLDEMHMTDHYARTYFAVEYYLANELVLEMLAKGKLSTDNEAVLAMIKGDDFVRSSHVFIRKNNGMYTEEENKAHAEAIYESIASKSTPAQRYQALREAIGGPYNHNMDNELLTGGYYFTRGEMEPVYESIVFDTLEVGEVAPVLETEAGYYVIMRLEKEDAYIEENFQTLKEKSYFVKLNRDVEARLAELTLKKTSFGEGLNLKNLPVIRAGAGSTAIFVALIAGGVLLVGGGVFLLVRVLGKKRKK